MDEQRNSKHNDWVKLRCVKCPYAKSFSKQMRYLYTKSITAPLPNDITIHCVVEVSMGCGSPVVKVSEKHYVRGFNSSCGVIQWLWDQYQSEESVSRRHIPSRPRATTFTVDHILSLSAGRKRATSVSQLVVDHYVAAGRRTSANMLRRHSVEDCQLCMSLSTNDREGSIYCGQGYKLPR
ncbi:paired domain-containing protein [Trichonephila clavipes]|nr:paired domain-containing protein [Trichonephila clavipes]